jgi:hypothetical protein
MTPADRRAVSFAAPLQTRLVLVLGLVAALGLAAFMLTRGGAAGGTEATLVTPSHSPASKPAARAQSTPAVHPAKAATAKPKVVLNPGLPANLARALQRERVVVAAVWAPNAGDKQALAEARAGAHEVGAGFVVLNVLEERKAKALERLAGPVSDPSVLVFKRPGTIVNRFDGFADTTTVAQAAQNAGAR